MSTPNKNLHLEKYPKKDDEKAKHENEDDFDKFVASLPTQNGWRSPLYQFQGFWHHPKMLQGFLQSQQHFEAQDSDVILITFPKCGTTWMKALLFAILNRNKHTPLSQQHPLLTSNPHALVPFIAHGISRGAPTNPSLLATHSPIGLLPKSVLESKCKLVYVSRNPKDTFVSYWHFANETKPENYPGISSIEEAVTMFCKGFSLCGPFWDHVLDYWKASLENPEKVLFLTYEELQKAPMLVVSRLAEFLGCSFSAEEEESGMVEAIVKLCSFESLSEMKVNKNGKVPFNGFPNKVFFRRGEVGDWKNYLSVEMSDQMDAVAQQKLQGTGLLELLLPNKKNE